MRSLHLILASTLIFAPALIACSDDGDAGSSGGSETGDGDPAGDGDGDGAEGGSASASGDGDGDDMPPPTGDGDGDTPPPPGDGDGDMPPPGDGDGDAPPPGDGDGDDVPPGECVPADDSECALCMSDSCCEQLMACAADDTCACITECFNGGQLNPMECFGECGVDNPMGVPGFGELRACQMENCGDACQMGGGGGGGGGNDTGGDMP